MTEESDFEADDASVDGSAKPANASNESPDDSESNPTSESTAKGKGKEKGKGKGKGKEKGKEKEKGEKEKASKSPPSEPRSDLYLDGILDDWDYDPLAVSVRLIKGSDDRDLIQMRVELGLLQLEVTGRPDGWRPEGADTYFDHLLQIEMAAGDGFVMDDEQCFECDREFVQFYHRRICWLAMQEYGKAVADADHTLGLMDYCARHSDDEEWIHTHEQYRPFVMYHRIQAHAMSKLVDNAPEAAVQSINGGLKKVRRLYEKHGLLEEFEDDELVARLIELRESLRDQFEVGRTLHEQLSDAVASEEYELAARIRDKLQNRRKMR